jgi:hypothetical protein
VAAVEPRRRILAGPLIRVRSRHQVDGAAPTALIRRTGQLVCYSWLVGLSADADSWTAPLDTRRLRVGDEPESGGCVAASAIAVGRSNAGRRGQSWKRVWGRVVLIVVR